MNTLDRDYQAIESDIRFNGNVKKDRTGTGTISLFGKMLRHKMSDGFPLLTTKKMFTSGIIDELIWFMKGNTNIRPLVLKGVNIWNGDAYKKYSHYHNNHPTIHSNRFDILSMDEFVAKIKVDERFADEWGELGRIYGKQWRDWRGHQWAMDAGEYYETSTDQLLNLIHDLKHNPDSRRLMVSSWKVDELEDMTLPPCHYHYQCYTRELKLEERLTIYRGMWLEEPPEATHEYLTKVNIQSRELSLAWNQRSVDTFLGLPFNIASYGFLLHILCAIVDMVPGELVGFFGDTHIYSNHLEAVDTQLERDSFDLPTLKLVGTAIQFASEYWHDGKFDLDDFLKNVDRESFKIVGYESHPTIKAPLSN